MKVQFGAGGNHLADWKNHDIEVNIEQRLPYGDGTVDFIFIEHCLEHTTPTGAWNFLKEARRILRQGGVIRVAVPSIERVIEMADREYLQHLSDVGCGAPTREAAVENQIVRHGHQALWSVPLLQTCFDALGFARAVEASVLTSDHPELRGIHGHGKTIGERNNLIETIVVDATK